jgi:hypothetical protein
VRESLHRIARLHLQIVQLQVNKLDSSQKFLLQLKICRASTHYADRDNCEMSDRDSRELDANNPMFFDHSGESDFYERFGGRAGSECLDGN